MKRLDIIIIHGLNNSKTSFFPLKKSLEKKGFKVHLFSLAGHSKVKNQISIDDSIKHLSNQFNKLSKNKKYNCIGFSQGGLVLQLLPTEIKEKINKQVLLAPALAVTQSYILEKIVDVLPKNLPLISLTPKDLRQFSWLSLNYFELLFKQINNLKTLNLKKPEIPSLIFIDPKDELIDVTAIRALAKEQKSWEFNLLNRPYLKFMHLGQYHVVFHPKYFNESQWAELIDKITFFFET